MHRSTRFAMATLLGAIATTPFTFTAAAGPEREGRGADRALPGRDVVKPMKPDWCAGFVDAVEATGRPEDRAGRELERIDRALGNGWRSETLVDLAVLACRLPADPAIQVKVARLRQEYINLTGLTEAEDRAAMKVRIGLAPRGDGDGGGDGVAAATAAVCKAPALTPTLDAFTAQGWRERQVKAPLRFAAGCDGYHVGAARVGGLFAEDDWLWLIDRRAAPYSEIARGMDVLTCLNQKLRERDLVPDPDDPEVMIAFALCGADGRRLDRRAFEKELAAAPFDPWTREVARARYVRAQTVTALLGDEYKARAAADPDLERVLFSAPEAAWTSWERAAATWKAELDLALAYEDKLLGNSKKAMLGCSAELRAGWQRYVAARKATTGEVAAAAYSEPVGFVLALATAACDDREGSAWLAVQTLGRLKEARQQRGPRTAAYWAVFDALVDVHADKEQWLLDVGHLPSNPRTPFLERVEYTSSLTAAVGDGDDAFARGEIKAVKAGAEGTLVTFRTVKVTSDVRECQDTGKLWGWNAHGSPIFHQTCKVVGKQTETVSPEPVMVPAAVAAGLAAGQYGDFSVTSGAGGARLGFPIDVWKDKARAQLVIHAGARL